MKRILTKYEHLFDAYGHRRAEPCGGHMEIVCDASGVCARCDTCGEGYRFQFVSTARGELASDGKP